MLRQWYCHVDSTKENARNNEMILTARDQRLRFLCPLCSLSRSHTLESTQPSSSTSSPHAAIPYITLSSLLSRRCARPYVHTSTSLARSAKGLVHKFAIRENIPADGQLRYREREEESASRGRRGACGERQRDGARRNRPKEVRKGKEKLEEI